MIILIQEYNRHTMYEVGEAGGAKLKVAFNSDLIGYAPY